MRREQIIILGMFTALIAVCACLVIVGNFLGAYAGTMLTDAGSEGLRSSIAGLVGALSMLIGVKNANKDS